jgi:hypothetical protein
MNQIEDGWTPEIKIEFRRLWDEGLSAGKIAARIGSTKDRVVRKASHEGLPARHIKGGPTSNYTAAQINLVKSQYAQTADVKALLAAVNGAGPTQMTQSQLQNLVKRLKLRKDASVKVVRYRGWHKPTSQLMSPAKHMRRIAIPLREVYRLNAYFGVPRRDCGSLTALNKAMEREKTGHPGYALMLKPCRIQWLS